jgi:hypothetical protein
VNRILYAIVYTILYAISIYNFQSERCSASALISSPQHGVGWGAWVGFRNLAQDCINNTSIDHKYDMVVYDDTKRN